MIIFLTQTGNFCTGCVQGELEGGRNCPENTGNESARVDNITSFVVSYNTICMLSILLWLTFFSRLPLSILLILFGYVEHVWMNCNEWMDPTRGNSAAESKIFSEFLFARGPTSDPMCALSPGHNRPGTSLTLVLGVSRPSLPLPPAQC